MRPHVVFFKPSEGHFILLSPRRHGGTGLATDRVKEILRVFRAVASELHMHAKQWPDLMPLLQSVLNNFTFTAARRRTSYAGYDRPRRYVANSYLFLFVRSCFCHGL